MIDKFGFLGSASLIVFVLLSSIMVIENSQIVNLFGKTNLAVSTLKDVTVVKMNLDGSRHYIAMVASVVSYRNNDVDFKMLHVLLESQDGSPAWHISSDDGTVVDNNSQIDLNHHVIAKRVAEKDYPALHVSTDHITLYPNKGYATTASRVTLTEPGTKNWITGVGMNAYDKPKKIIHLLSDVQSTYEPQDS